MRSVIMGSQFHYSLVLEAVAHPVAVQAGGGFWRFLGGLEVV